MKKIYQTPESFRYTTWFKEELLTLSSPGTGIHDGGPGKDDDDPSSKEREENEEWGSIW